ncbi:phage protein U [Brevibacillus aydinogluensis]|uniref:phage tail protein n=1 Tax=Brevibacillus aydinogluensis TaxID=927786 RepID=UPI0028931F67|nr:phage tail protein [Brevibacillus aydinogluensis]MDT3416179.1 phage protein U [Brevibacillus aydinogluensis]
MGQIGSFGEIVFEVSLEKIRTFSDLKRSASSRWNAHERFGQKPRSEFLGPNLDEISFVMRFDVSHGMDPKKEMDRLLAWCRSGRAETLIIGGIPIGMDKWVIKSVTQNWKVVDGSGRLLIGEADVTLEEYMRR